MADELYTGSVLLIGWVLIHFLWQGFAIWLLFKGLRRVFSARSSQFLYVLGCFCLCLLMIAPLATAWALSSHLAGGISASSTYSPGASDASKLENAVPIPEQLDARGLVVRPVLPEQTAFSRIVVLINPLVPWCVAAWCLGVFYMLLKQVGTHVLIYHETRRAESIDSVLSLQCAQIVKRFNIRRAVRFVRCSLVTAPATLGWLKPIVLLPTVAITGLSEHELQAIIAHELAHIRRHDYIVNIIQTLLETALFFHPCVWWISSVIRQDREDCCDDQATQYAGGPQFYVKALILLEKLRPENGLLLGSTGGSLMGRVQRLTRKGMTYRQGGLSSMLIIFLVAMSVLWYTGSSLATIAAKFQEIGWMENQSIGDAVYKILKVPRENPTLVEDVCAAVVAMKSGASADDSAIVRAVDSLNRGGRSDQLLIALTPHITLDNRQGGRNAPGWSGGSDVDWANLAKMMITHARQLPPSPDQARWVRAAVLLGSQESPIDLSGRAWRYLIDPDFSQISGLSPSTIASLRLAFEVHGRLTMMADQALLAWQLHPSESIPADLLRVARISPAFRWCIAIELTRGSVSNAAQRLIDVTPRFSTSEFDHELLVLQDQSRASKTPLQPSLVEIQSSQIVRIRRRN